MKNTPIAPPRRRSPNSSVKRDTAAGTSAASPLATKKRAAAICSKLCAHPDAAVQALQIRMPAAITRVRLNRSAMEPSSTAITPKLSTHTAPVRNPYWALFSARSRVISGAKPSSILRSMCASTCVASRASSTVRGWFFQPIDVSFFRCVASGAQAARRSGSPRSPARRLGA